MLTSDHSPGKKKPDHSRGTYLYQHTNNNVHPGSEKKNKDYSQKSSQLNTTLVLFL